MRVALGLLVLLLAPPAARAAEDCVATVDALWAAPPTATSVVRDSPRSCALGAAADAGARWVAAMVEEEIVVALARDGTALARGTFEPLTFDPPWSPRLEVAPERLLGPGVEAVRVTYRNAYLSTGRSTGSDAIHILVRRGERLVLVFSSLVGARHSAEFACPRGRRPPCRSAWARSWTVTAAPARTGAKPDLLVRNARSGVVVSRHRWRRDGYQPPIFDRTPALEPG